ncbi:MAG: hypothetical protein QXR65_09100 [Candidatus Bathyarchaeia archaeon]|nr:hypothetical protein [Candidatus Bathyarchaeota archaeon]
MPHRRSFLRLEARRRLREVYESAFYDRERAEIVATRPDALLDVLRGEVLMAPRFMRRFWCT